MLVTGNSHRLGDATIRYGVAVAPGLRIAAVRRAGMAFDSAAAPASRATSERQPTIYFLLAGTLAIRGGETFVGPALLLLPEALLDGQRGVRATTFVSGGARFEALMVCLATTAYAGPAPAALPAVRRLPLTPALLTAAGTAARALCDSSSQPVRATRVAAVLGALHVDGVLRAVPPVGGALAPAVRRLWQAATHVWSHTATLTLDELSSVAQVGPRQLRRDVVEAFAAIGLCEGCGWREAAVGWRLRLAVTLLSAPDATPHAVATALGYRRVSSMGRAFQNAGLPLPLELAPQLQATARALERGAQLPALAPGVVPARRTGHTSHPRR